MYTTLHYFTTDYWSRTSDLGLIRPTLLTTELSQFNTVRICGLKFSI